MQLSEKSEKFHAMIFDIWKKTHFGFISALFWPKSLKKYEFSQKNHLDQF